MAGDTRELRLQLKVDADASRANAAMKALGEQAAKVEKSANAAAKALGMGGGAGPGRPGGSSSPGRPDYGSSGSTISAFAQPVPVIIMGPRPLDVRIVGGGGGGGGIGGAGGHGAGGGGGAGGANKTLSVLRNLELGGLAGDVGRVQGYGDAASEMGMTKLGGGLNKMALPLALLKGSVDYARGIATIVHDNYTTQAEKGREFARMLPGGSYIQGSIDDFSGRAHAMEQKDIDSRLRQADVQARLEISNVQLGLGREMGGNAARAAGLAGARTVTLPGNIDFGTVADERQFREESRLLPIRQQTAKLGRESAVAAAEQTAAQKELSRIENHILGVEKERGRLRREQEDQESAGPFGGSGPARKETLNRLGNTEEELRGLQDQRRQARMGVYDATKNAAAAQLAVGHSKAEETRAQAESLFDRFQTAAGSAERLGGLRPWERQFAVTAALRAKRMGNLDYLTGEEVSALRGIAPMEYQKMARAQGVKSPEYAQLAAAGFDEFRDKPEDVRQAGIATQQAAAQQGLDAEGQAAKAIKGAGKDVAKELAGIIIQTFREMRQEILDEVRRGRGNKS